MKIPINKILLNPDQPRTIFDENELKGLAQSIKENKLIQPIVVDSVGDKYILVDGERRLRACKLLGSKTIEAVIRETETKNRLVAALIANVQRSSMAPIDEALAYKKIVAAEGSVVAAARKTGISETTIYLRLDLLKLPKEVQQLINIGKIPSSFKSIAALRKLNPDDMRRLAATAAIRGWGVQTIQMMVGRELKRQGKRMPPPREMIQNTYVEVGGHFNALAMVMDQHKLPEKARCSALSVCKDCLLYDEASAKICSQCPMVNFLNKLMVEMKTG